METTQNENQISEEQRIRIEKRRQQLRESSRRWYEKQKVKKEQIKEQKERKQNQIENPISYTLEYRREYQNQYYKKNKDRILAQQRELYHKKKKSIIEDTPNPQTNL